MSTDSAEQRAPDDVPADFDPWKPYPSGEAPALAAAPVPAPADDGKPPARPRSWGRRTALLIAASLVLGVLAGGGVGYAVQSHRPPTPLPPLTAPQPHYPAGSLNAAAAAAAAPAAQAVDGDLRKLLLKKPKGVKDWDYLPGEDGWMSAADMALLWGDSDDAFRALLGAGFRRAAEVSWREGDTDVRVRLIQYQPGHASETSKAISDAENCGSFKDDPCTEQKIPGTDTGVVYTTDKSQAYAESTERFYFGLAVARYGDVVMRIDVHSPRKVDIRHVADLAKRQWELL
ncbi:hypothetical protein [Peterkaempfera sp. SMS 1(5)a]|uniref:hypothetical protein n=1 Tax=Peterkaempfera podocarpi TaxID=3232308 RepID=UPI00366F7C10